MQEAYNVEPLFKPFNEVLLCNGLGLLTETTTEDVIEAATQSP
jgi:hypothetical protein